MFKKLLNLSIISSLLLGVASISFAQGQIFKYKVSVFNKSSKVLEGIIAAGEFIPLELGPGKIKELILRTEATKEELGNIQLVFEGQNPLDKSTNAEDNRTSFSLNSKTKFQHKIIIDEDGDLAFGESSGGIVFTLSPDKGEGTAPKLITLSAGQSGVAAGSDIAEKLSKLPHILLISAKADGEVHIPRGFFFGFSKTSVEPALLSVISEYYEDLGLYGLEDAADHSDLESEILKSALGDSELYFVFTINPTSDGFEILSINAEGSNKIINVNSSFYLGYLEHVDKNGNASTKIVISPKDPSSYLKDLNDDNKALSQGIAHRIFSMGGRLSSQEIKKDLGFGLVKVALAQGGFGASFVIEEEGESQDNLICPEGLPETLAKAEEFVKGSETTPESGTTAQTPSQPSAPTPATGASGGKPKDGGGFDFSELGRAFAGFGLGVQINDKGEVSAGVITPDGTLVPFGEGLLGGIPGTEGEKKNISDPFSDCGKSSAQKAVDEYLQKKQEEKIKTPDRRTTPTRAGSLRRFTDSTFGQLPERQLPQLPQQSVATPPRPPIQTLSPFGGSFFLR